MRRRPPRRRFHRIRDAVGRHPALWKSGVAAVVAGAALFTAVMTFDAQYQRRTDAHAHEREDAIRALWSQLGTTQLRASFLEDRVYDLTARKATLGPKFPISDDVSLQRYRTQLEQQTSRAAEIRRQIDESSRAH